MPENRPRGDPEGRRLAGQRARRLGEAAKLGRALEVLLTRASFGTEPLAELLTKVRRQEQNELMRSRGRIEPRKRFKGMVAHPMLDARSRCGLHLDECGKSVPEPLLLDPQYFALAGIALTEEAAAEYVEAADRLKVQFFRRSDITLHEPEMRTHDGLYYFEGDAGRQGEFDEALRNLIRDSEFVAFAVGVRKNGFAEKFVNTGVDPYLPTDVYSVAIEMLLERYLDYLATSTPRSLARVTFESQGPLEDAQHQLEYVRLLIEGTQWVSSSVFRNWLEPGLRFTPKRGSDPTELADILSREVYEWIRSDCAIAPRYWEIFRAKVYFRGDGAMGKCGIKVFPDDDIRDLVEADRQACSSARESV